MPKAPRYIEQGNPLQEQQQEALRVKDGGMIRGVEGGLRIDAFDHDENSEYDFSENDCTLCELPENAQEYIISDMEYEESNA